MIEVNRLTLKYPSGKGVFDLNFKVKSGEVAGYLGPNGAGKTTTIRALLGFMKPDQGSCSIKGLDCTQEAPEIQKSLGYIPGEIAFLDGMNGDEFLKFMCEMRGTRDLTRQKQLIDMFELDTKGSIKRFSKGMKQKVGIVTAFMHDPEVLILDEPTSGLDPLMQNRFVELILEEKKKGKTILMSSHMFEEVERTSDTVLIIKDGRIVKQTDVQSLKETQRKGYILKPKDMQAALEILTTAGYNVTKAEGDTLEVFIKNEGVDRFLKTAAQFTVLNLDVKSQSLEDIFMHFYSKEGK
jgi:ABC-2 type transport system ATP-binding protein